MNRQLVLIFLGLILFCCGTHTLKAETQRPFVFLAEEFPPFEYLKNNRAAGINIDIVSTIMKRLKIPFKVKFYPWSRLWLLAKKGKADAIMSISYRKSREAYINYTAAQKRYLTTGLIPPDTLWQTEYVFFVNNINKNSYKFKSYQQLKQAGYKIGIIKDYSYNPAFLAAKLHTQLLPNTQTAFKRLLEGKIDLFPCDLTVGKTFLQKFKLTNKLSYLPKPLFQKPYSIGFLKKSTFPAIKQVQQAFYQELLNMKLNGDFKRIRKKYIIYSTPRRKLIFACEEWMPFEYLKNNQPQGIDVELIDYIMNLLDIPYEIKFYPWSRAWMLIKKGKVDVALSVSYKPSREPYLYYTPAQRAFDKTGITPPDYLWLSEYVFFVKKKNRDKFKFTSYEQLKKSNYRIATNKNYAYNPQFRAANLKSTLIVNNTKEGFAALIDDKIDLYPIDKTIGLSILKDLGFEDSITYLPTPLFIKPYLAPRVKKSTYPGLNKIITRFYQELNQLRKNGLYQKITNKYTPLKQEIEK